VTSENIEQALSKGHEAALKLADSGDSSAASIRLKLMFDATVKLSLLCGHGGETGSNSLASWLNAWDSSSQPISYTTALNDYGRFLEKSGQASEA
ncbi:hypothetical protein, partial [Escherichia coli]